MALSLNCRHCNQDLTGETEEELVATVQQHVRGHAEARGLTHEVSAE